MSEVAGCCWPEQEAVSQWIRKHNIGLTNEEEYDLKVSVSAYRITRDEEIESLREQLATLESRYLAATNERIQINVALREQLADRDEQIAALQADIERLKTCIRADSKLLLEATNTLPAPPTEQAK